MKRESLFSKGWNGVYQLVTEQGKPVSVGQKVIDFRGDTDIITGGYAPHKPESNGFVTVKGDRFGRSYADVYNLRWKLTKAKRNPRRTSLRSLKRAEAEHYAQPAVSIDIDVDSHNARRGSKTRVNPRLKLGKKMRSVDFAPVPSRITYGPNHYATIRKNNLGEYVVRFWTYGKHIKDADYFAADQKDAVDTANAELTRMTQVKSNPLKGEKHIALQEKRGNSWFTIAYFPHNQKALAIKLGKQVHRRYPNKALRLFA